MLTIFAEFNFYLEECIVKSKNLFLGHFLAILNDKLGY